MQKRIKKMKASNPISWIKRVRYNKKKYYDVIVYYHSIK